MKRALLLLLGIFSFVSLNAKDFEISTTKTSIYNRYDNAITFIEKGVQFHVFLDGEFEFNNPYGRSRYYDYNGRRFSNKNIRVYRDYRGRITKIGSNRIRYDYKGNVTRIGKVRLYYRQGLLRRVGDLKISYDSWGEPYFYGNVNNYDYYDSDIRFSINIGPIFDYNDRFFYRRNFRNNYRKYREDKHYYYYKARPDARVDKGKKIIKRRKSGVSIRNNNDNKRRATPKVQERRNSTKKKVQRRDTNKRYEKRRS